MLGEPFTQLVNEAPGVVLGAPDLARDRSAAWRHEEDGSNELPDRLDSRRQPARVHPFCRISVIEIVVAPGESLVDDAPFA